MAAMWRDAFAIDTGSPARRKHRRRLIQRKRL